MKEYWLSLLRAQLNMVEAKIMTLKVEKEKVKGEYDNAKEEVSTQEEILDELNKKRIEYFMPKYRKIGNLTAVITLILLVIVFLVIAKYHVGPFIGKTSFKPLLVALEMGGSAAFICWGVLVKLENILKKRVNKKIGTSKEYQNLLEEISSQEKTVELAKSNRNVKQNRFYEIKTKYDKERHNKFEIKSSINWLERQDDTQENTLHLTRNLTNN